jgi:hypothetical protein
MLAQIISRSGNGAAFLLLPAASPAGGTLNLMPRVAVISKPQKEELRQTLPELVFWL